jgi:hypothetical protein
LAYAMAIAWYETSFWGRPGGRQPPAASFGSGVAERRANVKIFGW